MQAELTTGVEFDQPVSKIAELNGKLMEVYVKGQKLDQQFSAVISTVPLPRLGLMDLSECAIHENFTQWSAMRSLQYGPSIKIGIRFSRPWWQDKRFGADGGIKGGQR
jgi:monoamine oxidase